MCSSSQIQFPQHSVFVRFLVFPHRPHRATAFALDGLAAFGFDVLQDFFLGIAATFVLDPCHADSSAPTSGAFRAQSPRNQVVEFGRHAQLGSPQLQVIQVEIPGLRGTPPVPQAPEPKGQSGSPDSEVDGQALSEAVAREIQTLNREGFRITSITPVTSGAYGFEREFRRHWESWFSAGAGYGYGYSYTEGVLILAER